MTASREQRERRLREVRSQREEAIVMGLATPGLAGIFNERVQDLNQEIDLLERAIAGDLSPSDEES